MIKEKKGIVLWPWGVKKLFLDAIFVKIYKQVTLGSIIQRKGRRP